MAFPRSISGLVLPQQYDARPMRDGNGNHYIVGLDSSAGTLEVWKADNGDNTWSEVDSAGAPAENDINGISAVLVGDVIHIATITLTDDPCDVYYHTFHVSSNGTTPDEWVTVDEAVSTGNDTRVNTTASHRVSIIVRSTGERVIAYQGEHEQIMGGRYLRAYVTMAASGSSTWSTPLHIGDGGQNGEIHPKLLVDDADLVHIGTYFGGVGADHRSLNGSSTLSSVEQMNDNAIRNQAISGGSIEGTYWKDGSDQKAVFAWLRASPQNPAGSVITNDGTPESEIVLGNSASATLAGISVHDLVEHGGIYYSVWIDSSTQDLFVTENDGGSLTHTEIEDAQTANYLGASKLVIDNGDTVLAVVYDDDTLGVGYTEWLIEAAGGNTDVTPASADADAQASLGALEIDLAPDGASKDAQASLGDSDRTLNPAIATKDAQASLGMAFISAMPEAAVADAQAGDPVLAINLSPDGTIKDATSERGLLNVTLNPDGATSDAQASVGNVSLGIKITPAGAIADAQASLGGVAINLSPDEALNGTDVSTDINITINPAEVIGVATATRGTLNVTITKEASGDAQAEDPGLSITLTPDDAVSTSQVSRFVNRTVVPGQAINDSDASYGTLNVTLAPDESISTTQTQRDTNVTLNPDGATKDAQASVGNVDNSGEGNITPDPAVSTSDASRGTLNVTLDNRESTKDAVASLGTTVITLSPDEAVNGSDVDQGIAITLSPDASVSDATGERGLLDVTLAPDEASRDAQASVGNVINSSGGNTDITPAAAVSDAQASRDNIVVTLSPDESIATSLSGVSILVTLSPDEALRDAQAQAGNQSVVITSDNVLSVSNASIGQIDHGTSPGSADSDAVSGSGGIAVILSPDEALATTSVSATIIVSFITIFPDPDVIYRVVRPSLYLIEKPYGYRVKKPSYYEVDDPRRF